MDVWGLVGLRTADGGPRHDGVGRVVSEAVIRNLAAANLSPAEWLGLADRLREIERVIAEHRARTAPAERG